METAVKIRTNNVPRPVIDAWELSPKEREEFDYLDWAAIERGEDGAQFVRYGKRLLDLGEFSRVIPPGAERLHPMECGAPEFHGWDGYLSDSYFSGLLIRWARDENGEPDPERVVVGFYSC